MPQLFDIKFPAGCQTLPEGFWSAVDVWVKKPHVVNKRLCGVKETESGEVNVDALRFLLNGAEISQDVFSFLSCDDTPEQTHDQDKYWTSSVRTFIPKVNCCGNDFHKEVILKDFVRQQVTFLPYEEQSGGQVSLKRGNVYQIRLLHQDCEEWSLELHVLAPDAWFSDGIVYPKLPWLSSDLLPKLVRWASECRSSEFRSTLSLLPVEKYSIMYQQLKEKYKAMVKVWPEVTDPEKFVYEDVAIASYLLHPGKGIDVRRRKLWDMFGPQTLLEEKAITPSESFLFPSTDWLIGNHSDELTPWIPVMAARSSYSCRFFVLPCCFFDFYGKYQRRQCKKSQYKEYIDFITEVGQVSGFNIDEDCLRIPSTKRVCLLGKSRNYEQPDEAEAEQRRACYVQSRQAAPGVTVQVSHAGNDCCRGNEENGRTPGNSWGAGFQPRDRVEVVRNCAALPRDFVDSVVLQVANVLLGMTEDGGRESDWNRGGSLAVSEVAGLLEQETLQLLKKECGGLQTLLKNNHQVFRVEGGRVHIRDWREKSTSRSDLRKKKPIAPGALKTRPCWFYNHHPQRCPLQADQCHFAHGPDDLRPSTRPLKKIKNDAF